MVSSSEKNTTHQFGDVELAVTVASPGGFPRAAVILLHGGPGGQRHGPANLYSDLAEILASHGFMSIRFDFSGAGESTGQYRDMTIRGQVAEFKSVYDAFVRDIRCPHVVVGESYGATIAILGLPTDAAALALLWPALWLLDKTFESYVTEEKLSEAEEQGFIIEEGTEIGADFLRELLEVRDLEDELQSITVPTLLLHGTADTEVPSSQSINAADLIVGPTRLRLIEGGNHCLEEPLERKVVYEELSSWLDELFPRAR